MIQELEATAAGWLAWTWARRGWALCPLLLGWWSLEWWCIPGALPLDLWNRAGQRQLSPRPTTYSLHSISFRYLGWWSLCLGISTIWKWLEPWHCVQYTADYCQVIFYMKINRPFSSKLHSQIFFTLRINIRLNDICYIVTIQRHITLT